MGSHAGVAGDSRHASFWSVRKRVPDPDHGHARTSVGSSIFAARALRRVRFSVEPRAADGVRGNFRQAAAAPARGDPRVIHLGLALMLGLYIPAYLEMWY